MTRRALYVSPVVTPRQRVRIRRAIRAHGSTLQSLAAQVASNCEGPDPEAALVFLRMLAEECEDTRTAAGAIPA